MFTIDANPQFYIVEFHPFTHMFDESWQGLDSPYFYGKAPMIVQQEGSYADTSAAFSHPSYEWPHTMSEVINALRQAGLIIEFLNEFPFSVYNCFPSLEESMPGEYTLKGRKNSVPLMYSIKAIYNPTLSLGVLIMQNSVAEI